MIKEVSYLGPEGSYTQDAAIEMYGEGIDLVSLATKPAVLSAAESGAVGAAVLPLENSTEGGVSETHRLLIGTDLKIVRETILPIQHCLLTSDRIDRDEIRQVYAHSQALGQCSRWLYENMPHIELVPVGSNSAAAEIARTNQASAAIASARAAEVYELKIAQKGINDSNENFTRFISLSDKESEPTERDKTSLVCRSQNDSPDDPGALVRIISPLAYRGINMSSIHSIPVGRKYMFYIELDGGNKDKNVQEALADIERQTQDFKVLGSYPVAELLQ